MTTGQAVIDDLDPYYEDYNDSYQFPEDLNDVYDVLDMQSPINTHYPIDQEFQNFSGPEEYYTSQFSGPEDYYAGNHPAYHTIGAGDEASYMFMHSMDSSHPLARTI